MSKPSIPTQADFDRAKEARAHRDRNWDEISKRARVELSEVFDLHEFAIFPGNCRFEAILFFETNRDVERAANGGAESTVRKMLRGIIQPFRPECSEIDIVIELDSYENVKANFGGSYFNRLR